MVLERPTDEVRIASAGTNDSSLITLYLEILEILLIGRRARTGSNKAKYTVLLI